ncbi:MAG: signal peptidase I [Clostridia bacterium]|nr:signal peptidase I [Clostridia bacterium]
MKDRKNGYIYYDYHKKTEKEEISDTAWTSVFHWLYGIVGFLFVLFIVFVLFFKVVEVDGESMSPTLNDNDKLLIYTMNYTPKQGDIVVISADDEQTLIKRIVATENQTVEVDYKTGKVIVDGMAIDEKYVTEMSEPEDNEISYPYTVPEDCVFVMGDNRNESRDSRSKVIKAVEEYRIVGKAITRLIPFSDGNIYE